MTDFDPNGGAPEPQQGVPGPSPTAPASQTNPSGGAGPSASGESGHQAVPLHRFREVASQARQYREQFTSLEARFNALEAERERERRQFAAAMGLAPNAPETNQADDIRQALYALSPKLQWLDEKGDELERLLGHGPELEANLTAQYDQLADHTLNRVYEQAQQVYGGQLSPMQRSFLHAAFVRFVDMDDANKHRYIQGDPGLTSDFWKQYNAGFLDPIRRSATAAVTSRAQQRATLPQAGPTTGPLGTAPPAPSLDEDEVHNRAWQRFQAQTR